MKSSSSFNLSAAERDVIVESSLAGLRGDTPPRYFKGDTESPREILKAWRAWRGQYVRHAIKPNPAIGAPGESRESARANRRLHDVEHDLAAKLLGIRTPKLAKEAST